MLTCWLITLAVACDYCGWSTWRFNLKHISSYSNKFYLSTCGIEDLISWLACCFAVVLMQHITLTDLEEYLTINWKLRILLYYDRQFLYIKSLPFGLLVPTTQDELWSCLGYTFYPGFQKAAACLTYCLWSSVISSQDWVGQASGECALFDHKCDKNWQAGSLCTQVGHYHILLASKK